MTSWAVAGPTFSAQPMSLEGVHSAWARWALGMCSATVGRSTVVAPGVGRHAPTLEEDRDGCGGVADLDLLSDQLVGHAVEVAVNFDVVVDVDATDLPAREDVARDRQGPQGGAVELLVEGAAADAELLQRPVVERVEEDADRPVQSADPTSSNAPNVDDRVGRPPVRRGSRTTRTPVTISIDIAQQPHPPSDGPRPFTFGMPPPGAINSGPSGDIHPPVPSVTAVPTLMPNATEPKHLKHRDFRLADDTDWVSMVMALKT